MERRNFLGMVAGLVTAPLAALLPKRAEAKPSETRIKNRTVIVLDPKGRPRVDPKFFSVRGFPPLVLPSTKGLVFENCTFVLAKGAVMEGATHYGPTRLELGGNNLIQDNTVLLEPRPSLSTERIWLRA